MEMLNVVIRVKKVQNNFCSCQRVKFGHLQNRLMFAFRRGGSPALFSKKENTMIKKCTAVLLCIALTVSFAFLAGCGHKNDISSGAGANDFPVTINNVTIGSAPTGTAVLSPNAADVVLALGYEINLKAKSADCTQADLSALPNVTANDADKIKSNGANLVLADPSLKAEQKSALEKAGLTVVTLAPATSRSDLLRLYSQVGSAIKGAVTGYKKGKAIANGIFETIDDITRSAPQKVTLPTAVYLYDIKGHAATGDTIAGSLVKAAGLQNIADSTMEGKYSVSDMLIANPTYIFCARGLRSSIMESPQYARLSAVKNKRVYEMDPNMMTLQGEQMVNAVSFMAGTAYPQLLQGTVSDGTSPNTSSSSANASSSSSTSSSPINTNQTLRTGMKNDDVLKMQNRLLQLGYMFVKPSGLFADGTEQAVKDFQYLNGLPSTGIADPATLQKIFSSSAKKR